MIDLLRLVQYLNYGVGHGAWFSETSSVLYLAVIRGIDVINLWPWNWLSICVSGGFLVA